MCNLYSNTTTQEAMRGLFKGLSDRVGNLGPGKFYPDQLAPIIRHADGGLELVTARWVMPSPPSVLKPEEIVAKLRQTMRATCTLSRQCRSGTRRVQKAHGGFAPRASAQSGALTRIFTWDFSATSASKPCSTISSMEIRLVTSLSALK